MLILSPTCGNRGMVAQKDKQTKVKFQKYAKKKILYKYLESLTKLVYCIEFRKEVSLPK